MVRNRKAATSAVATSIVRELNRIRWRPSATAATIKGKSAPIRQSAQTNLAFVEFQPKVRSNANHATSPTSSTSNKPIRKDAEAFKAFDRKELKTSLLAQL